MFKTIISHKGFWRSVLVLAFTFVLLFTLIKWALDGFQMAFFTEQNPLYFFLGTAAAGFVYGFFVTYGKFRSRIKNKDSGS